MKKILFAFAAALMLLSCSEPASRKELASHVIVIGLDGWGTWCMEKGEYPFIREMMQEGSWTLNKRVVLPSISGANWAAMMNGTPDLMKEQRPAEECGVVCEWGDFLNYADTLCLDYYKRIANASQNPDDIVTESVKYITEKKPVLCFIHIDALDHMGHSYGQGSEEYYAELPKVDERVRQIVEGVKAAGIYDDSIIMITSDHGHVGHHHGGHDQLEIQTPFVIWGKGVKKNHQIKETMIQYDMAATVARILNLETPQSWRGKVIEVFE